ncbi:hypothetical protein PMAYCL1PPCAC_23329, partial [Pristionchus mayeri]
CRYLGRSYPEGTVWKAPHDPCSRFICHEGIVTWYRVGCPCHRRGPKCNWNNTEVDACSRDACPVLNCLPEYQLKREEKCCPRCDPEMPRESSSPLSFCRFRGIDRKVGLEFRVDPCTQCVCMKGGLVCRRHVCSFLPSPRSSQCCESNCIVDHHGKTLIRRNGTRWRSSSAVCSCLNGRITCESPWKEGRVSCYSQRGSLKGVGDSLLIAPSCHYYLLVRTGLTVTLRVSADNIPSLYVILRQNDTRVIVVFSSLRGESTATVYEPDKKTEVEAGFPRIDPPMFSIHYNNQFILIANNDLYLRWNGSDFNITSSSLNGTGICLSSPSNRFARGKICSKNQYFFTPVISSIKNSVIYS